MVFMTIMVNYPSKLHSYTYSHTKRYTEAVNEFTTLYNEKYSNIKTVLAVNNNAVIYNSFGVIPWDKYDAKIKECLNQNYKLAAEKNHMEMYIKKE